MAAYADTQKSLTLQSIIFVKTKKNTKLFYTVHYFFFFFFFSSTVLQCDLPPLRPHCGEAPGRDSNPGRAAQRQGHFYTVHQKPRHLERF